MSTEEIQPLRLATGSHQAGSGRGCAMNVISWENGDTTISDYPECSDKFLARMVQIVNDSICTHTKEDDLLCAKCSVEALKLGHRTVGTHMADHGWSTEDQAWLYAAMAIISAKSAEKYANSETKARNVETLARVLASGARFLPEFGDGSVPEPMLGAKSTMEFAHATIDYFEHLTGLPAAPDEVPIEVLRDALEKMLASNAS